MAFRIRLHLPLNITATFSQLLALRHPQLALGFPRSVETRCSIASAFPNCPAHWIGLASSRLSGSRISGADRARRAWLAGCWAKAVVDGWKDQRRCATLSLQRRRAGSILRRLASSTHRLKIRSNHGSGEVHCRHLHALCAGDACFGKGRGWHCSRSGFGGYQKALRNPFGCSSRVLPSRCLGRWSSGCARRFDWSFYKSGGVHVDLVLVDMAPDILDHLSLVRDFSGPTHLLHLFMEDPFLHPDKEELLAAAWDWIIQPEEGDSDRLHYYFAEEAAEAEEEEMIPEAPAQEPLAGTRPGAKHVARPILGASKPKALRHKKPTVAQLATSLESILNTLPVLTPPDGGVVSEGKGYGDFKQGPSHFSLHHPLGDSSLTGLPGGSTTPAAELLEEMLHQRQSPSPNQRGLGRRSRSRLQMGRRHQRRPLSFCGVFW